MSTRPSGLEQLKKQLLDGRLTRRDVLKRTTALGLSAPVIAGLLAACGGGDDDEPQSTEQTAAAEPTPVSNAAASTPTEAQRATVEATTEGQAAAETPTEQTAPTEIASSQRGGGGKLRLLAWQAPTILNPHLAQSDKDYVASIPCLEGFCDWDENDEPIRVLAAEWPTIENGLLDPNGMFVIWKLRQGVKWHDGEDFTADDVKFTWEYIIHPDAATTFVSVYETIESVDIIDDYTVQFNFAAPNPNWFEPFQSYSAVLPEHILRDSVGVNAMFAEFNLKPVGTGPWKVVNFTPGDVINFEIFEDYWDPGKPFFDEVELKGGGDASSAARAVLVSEEADYAHNLQVESALLEQMEADGGIGQIIVQPGRSAERILINHADPNTAVDGAVSEPSTQHPIWKHKAARQALNLAVRRDVISEELFGVGGEPTGDLVNVPQRFRLNWPWEYDLEQARAKLAEIDFPNAFSNTRLLFQTTINSVRQKTQEIIKADLDQLGFQVEIKAIDASVFFSTDAGNPDTSYRFEADLQMLAGGPETPYPIAFARSWRGDNIPQKSTGWIGTNRTRWSNPEFDRLHDQAQVTIDEAKQLEIWNQMLTLVHEEVVEVPIVLRNNLAGINNRIKNWTVSRFGYAYRDMKNWTA